MRVVVLLGLLCAVSGDDGGTGASSVVGIPENVESVGVKNAPDVSASPVSEKASLKSDSSLPPNDVLPTGKLQTPTESQDGSSTGTTSSESSSDYNVLPSNIEGSIKESSTKNLTSDSDSSSSEPDENTYPKPSTVPKLTLPETPASLTEDKSKSDRISASGSEETKFAIDEPSSEKPKSEVKTPVSSISDEKNKPDPKSGLSSTSASKEDKSTISVPTIDLKSPSTTVDQTGQNGPLEISIPSSSSKLPTQPQEGSLSEIKFSNEAPPKELLSEATSVLASSGNPIGLEKLEPSGSDASPIEPTAVPIFTHDFSRAPGLTPFFGEAAAFMPGYAPESSIQPASSLRNSPPIYVPVSPDYASGYPKERGVSLPSPQESLQSILLRYPSSPVYAPPGGLEGQASIQGLNPTYPKENIPLPTPQEGLQSILLRYPSSSVYAPPGGLEGQASIQGLNPTYPKENVPLPSPQESLQSVLLRYPSSSVYAPPGGLEGQTSIRGFYPKENGVSPPSTQESLQSILLRYPTSAYQYAPLGRLEGQASSPRYYPAYHDHSYGSYPGAPSHLREVRAGNSIGDPDLGIYPHFRTQRYVA